MSHDTPGLAVILQAMLLLLGLSFAGATASSEALCSNVPVGVVGGSRQELQMACTAAETAIQRLGRCGLAMDRPLQIRIEPRVHHPLGGPVFALFEGGERGHIRLTQFAGMPTLTARTPFAGLPLPDLYRSLIVHEVVHGVLHQSPAGRSMGQVANEYLAHALQIASLPPDARRLFLNSLPAAAQSDDLLFTDVMLSLNPYLFAARAYQHFEALGDECRQTRTLLQGAATFIASSRDLL